MRSILLNFDPSQESVDISGDKLHHLVHVVRIEQGDELLLLDGRGQRVLGCVEFISKKVVRVKLLGKHPETNSHRVDAAIGIPKKEALEACLKQSCELAIRNVFLVRASYSQMKVPEPDRILSILESGLEQSNAAYLPHVRNLDWKSVPWAEYDRVVLFDSQSGKNQLHRQVGGKTLLVIGPEGGFSPEELSFFDTLPNLRRVFLPTAILRTPTALSTGLGFVLGALLD